MLTLTLSLCYTFTFWLKTQHECGTRDYDDDDGDGDNAIEYSTATFVVFIVLPMQLFGDAVYLFLFLLFYNDSLTNNCRRNNSHTYSELEKIVNLLPEVYFWNICYVDSNIGIFSRTLLIFQENPSNPYNIQDFAAQFSLVSKTSRALRKTHLDMSLVCSDSHC